MVDSVSNNSANTLLRAQAASSAAKVAPSSPTIVAAKQKTAVTTSAKNVPAQQPIKFAGASGNLPRGSLIDITA